MTASFSRVVVIGASAGGISALLELGAALPRPFPAPVCIVQHIGAHPSLLPELLRYRGPNPAVHPRDGERLAPGTLYVAPADTHMLLDGDVLRLRQGPRENHARPAIDPLFRSAARSWGERVVGVILTGQMDDGTAGLKAVKECGGTAIVQDPATAAEQEMPRSALQNVAVDHCVPLAALAPLLVRLVGEAPPAGAPRIRETVLREVAINQGAATVENLEPLAAPSTLTCPDCGGTLWEVKEHKPLRYRCHTGHAFGALSLAQAQKDAAEQALFAGVRALREREILLRRMAAITAATGDTAQAAVAQAQADRLREQVRALQRLAEHVPSAARSDAVP
ncbi:chemotaxis protein CheB [Ramlibacter sp. USB13]|uniref:protein-glutamate methylesterase n=1 Tax=Ramlibacter cellulosilyticus TaxID=2764187 RepID=A0A923SEM5_9BURK|nr:chemotaxis protein CheB [Ramlibacter cellulosilyticus]MBC5783087.1 chemotaxis protein CheB [Ramlibacter cellulosilyticus]